MVTGLEIRALPKASLQKGGERARPYFLTRDLAIFKKVRHVSH
jgi:hypothetical protein